ncbi:hypothetical protein I3843_08G111000 [Carya illinoinensis]|nr:hypothetical protein I3843_08G111000 [Carya illinoinensis]
MRISAKEVCNRAWKPNVILKREVFFLFSLVSASGFCSCTGLAVVVFGSPVDVLGSVPFVCLARFLFVADVGDVHGLCCRVLWLFVVTSVSCAVHGEVVSLLCGRNLRQRARSGGRCYGR